MAPVGTEQHYLSVCTAQDRTIACLVYADVYGAKAAMHLIGCSARVLLTHQFRRWAQLKQMSDHGQNADRQQRANELKKDRRYFHD